MAKILKHLGFGKKPPMPPRVDYNMRSYLGLGMPIRCNSESNLLEAVAEERAINKMTHRSQDDTQTRLSRNLREGSKYALVRSDILRGATLVYEEIPHYIIG
ncbi:hypothetical protein MRX96_004701 [Rhipicephalus microplus]